MRHVIGCLLLVSGFAFADEATIISFEHKTALSRGAGIFDRGLESDDYVELVVAINGLELTCRTYSIGGGTGYIQNNPLQFVVGRTLEAEIWKDRELRVTVPDRNRPLKFDIQSARSLK